MQKDIDTYTDKTAKKALQGTTFAVLFALSFSHLSNDTLQSLIPALYPLLKDSLVLTFSQIGLITLVFQLSSSLLQPIVGWITDKKPQPYALPIGMCFTMTGLISLSLAHSFESVLISVCLTGIGSSIFHPEASRLAHMAAGGRFGLAQSIFQVGGNLGSSLGPLLAALFIATHGQQNIAWFALLALACLVVMLFISRWYKRNLYRIRSKVMAEKAEGSSLPKKRIVISLLILLVLIFSKYLYMTSISSYYTFYLMHKFGVSIQSSQLFLFAYLFAIAAGTFIGGPVGDRIGRKYVIWISILGVAPFTLLLPYVDNLTLTCVLTVFIGLILSSAFSAILVYAQELLPGKVGTISGFFFGFAFGVAGIGSAILGKVADSYGIDQVYFICSFLPLIGLITAFLPNLKKQ